MQMRYSSYGISRYAPVASVQSAPFSVKIMSDHHVILSPTPPAHRSPPSQRSPPSHRAPPSREGTPFGARPRVITPLSFVEPYIKPATIKRSWRTAQGISRLPADAMRAQTLPASSVSRLAWPMLTR